MSAIQLYRTAELGSHVEGCRSCGTMRVAYNFCPQVDSHSKCKSYIERNVPHTVHHEGQISRTMTNGTRNSWSCTHMAAPEV